GSFVEPEDLFVDQFDHVYVADTGNNRSVKLDEQFSLVSIIDRLEFNGEFIELSAPTGIFVDEDLVLYVADKGNGRILRVQPNLKVDLIIENPEHSLIPEDFVFKPIKVAADSAGRIYVLSEGQYYGLMQFDIAGQFTSYYGSNKVEVTPF